MIAKLLALLKNIDPKKFRLEIDPQGYVILEPTVEYAKIPDDFTVRWGK